MKNTTADKSEYQKQKKKNRTIFYYIDKSSGIDKKSREVYKNKEIHFPFRTNDGSSKYTNIKAICYEDTASLKTLPPGFLKSYKTGYGFTRELSPILYKLQKEYVEINRLVISKNRPSQILKRTIVLNYESLEKARTQIKNMLGKHKDESEAIVNNLLCEIFPEAFKSITEKYPLGEISRIFSRYKLTYSDLTENEVRKLLSLLSTSLKNQTFNNKDKIIATKKEIDYIYFEKILEEFDKISSQTTPSGTLENKWQDFFKDNILYFNFGYIDTFEKEKVFGDKKVNYPDFILLDTYNFLDVYEIKTHLTQILSYDTGRGNFYWHAEMAKAISQSENYIDAIIGREAEVIKNIRDEYKINVDAIRPTVYIIAGSRKILAGSQTPTFSNTKKVEMKNDFRRLNNSLKNIKIFTHDDLRETFDNMLKKLNKN